MVPRSILVHRLRIRQTSSNVARNGIRRMGLTTKTHRPLPSTQEKSWLTSKVESSSSAMKIFLALTNLLGYGSPKQIAGRRAFALYDQVCAAKPDQDRSFWRDGMFCATLLHSPVHNTFFFQNASFHQHSSPGLL